MIKGKTRETWRRKVNGSKGRNPHDCQTAENSKTGETRRHKARGSKVAKVTRIARLPKSKPGENRRRKVMGLKPAQVKTLGWSRLPDCRMCKIPAVGFHYYPTAGYFLSCTLPVRVHQLPEQEKGDVNRQEQ
jgi:hypothetical protein